jgi:hypothetical protein
MKKPQTLKIRNAASKFAAFEEKAAKLGFVRIPQKREQRDLKMQKVVPPKSSRLEGLENQVILEKQVDDYTIRIPTTYNPKLKAFAQNGKLWVRIVALDKKGRESGVFTWKTTRTGDFLDRALMMMDFLAFKLDERDTDANGDLMKLESWVGVDKRHPYVWVGRMLNGKKFYGKSFTGTLPGRGTKEWTKVHKFIMRWIRDVWYYETKRRLDLGYKRREREIRKPYTVNK